MTAQNLNGLPPVFSSLKLLEDKNGHTMFRLDSGPLCEVFGTIQNRSIYGEPANREIPSREIRGRTFWMGFRSGSALRCVPSALRQDRNGDQGADHRAAQSVQAQSTFKNNNFFRQAAFRPRVDDLKPADLVHASEAFQEVFGKELPELEAGSEAAHIREAVLENEDAVQEMTNLLVQNSLPGSDALEQARGQMAAIRSGKQSHAIQTFLSAHAQIKEAIARATQLRNALTEPNLMILRRAKEVLGAQWSF